MRVHVTHDRSCFTAGFVADHRMGLGPYALRNKNQSPLDSLECPQTRALQKMMIGIVRAGMLMIAIVLVASGILESVFQIPAHNLLCTVKSCWVVDTVRRTIGPSGAGYFFAAMDVLGLVILRMLYPVAPRQTGE